MRLPVHTIERTLSECFRDKQSLLVAFSGGSDSLALLTALATVGKNVVAVYVDHQIRGKDELQKERQLNAENCRRLGVEFVVLTVDAAQLSRQAETEGVEQAARFFRYALLLEECRKRSLPLVTAHNADDQMETVLMHLFQGGDPIKLAIPSQTTLDGVCVYRPLLSFSHEELRAYLREKQFSWSEDSTNNDDLYLRNKLRHTVVPAILGTFPGGRNAVARFAKRSEDLASFVRGTASSVPLDGGKLRRKDFLEVPPFARDEVLYRFLSAEGRIPYSAVLALRQALEGDSLSWRMESCGRLICLNDGILSLENAPLPSSFMIPLEGMLDAGISVNLPDGSVFSISGETDNPLLLRIDSSLLRHPLLRSPLEDDTIALSGGTVRLAKLLNEWHIAPALRRMIPVLEDQDGLVAVFASAYGGRDRLALKYKSLAPIQSNVYSVFRRK